MSESKPVENAVETAAKVVDSAVALTAPTTAPVAAAKAAWWATRSRKRLAMVAGGVAIVLAGSGYGYKYFTAQPGTASAQTNLQAVAEAKPEATPPARSNQPIDEIPEIKPPALKPPTPAGDIELPSVKPPAPNKADTSPPPPPVPIIDIDLPPIKSPVKNDIDVPTLVIPPTTRTEKKEKKPETIDSELFKAPDPVPTTAKDNTRKPDSAPVIRIGASESKDDKKDPPPIPDIDIKIPPPPPAPASDRKDPPLGPDIDIKIPSAPMPMKADELPKIGPSPKIDVPPPPPVVDVPPTIKTPMIPETPTIRIDVPMPMPRVDVPPPPPLVGPKKKDMYDEDWHTQREGDTYMLISKEYYKTADFAQALEAYNKDRRKAGERIIRVPPTWVLEEQFPNLTGSKAEKPETPEAKSPGSVKFEPTTPATPSTSGGRPAPPPASAVGNDEYRVKAEAGETIREIARKVYGSPESWKKLWGMNPNLDPTQPIPSGTTLRLGR